MISAFKEGPSFGHLEQYYASPRSSIPERSRDRSNYPPLPSSLTNQPVSLTSFLYSIFSIIAAYAFASDLSRGTSTVFLSQPLTRRGYVVTWMLAVVTAPAVVYLLSFMIPFVVLDVKLLTSDPVDFLLLLETSASVVELSYLARNSWGIMLHSSSNNTVRGN